MATNITLFNYFTYANDLKDLVSDAFPALNDVSWTPTDAMGFVETRYADLALPAFFMNFTDPDFDGKMVFRKGVDILDPDSQIDAKDAGDYYMGIGLNVVGYLVLPVFPEANPDVPNTNPVLLTLTAGANLAAFINARAGGLGGAGLAKVTNIHYIDDGVDPKERNYHVAEIAWTHDAYIGNIPTDECAVDIDQIWAWLNPDWDGDEKPDSDRVYDLRTFGFPDDIPDYTFTRGTAIDTVELPTIDLPTADSMINVGSIDYLLTPDLPTGLALNTTNQQITGTPTAQIDKTEYTYEAVYTEGDRRLTYSQKFNITVN